MNEDIGPIMKKWKYLVDDINVRIITGLDGKPKLQLRLDLGILQMELDGRPDGKRPARHDSYLTYYEKKASDSTKGKFYLTPGECMKLQQEAIQYYHRYLALMKLEDFQRVIRDTTRNLQVFDFVEKFSNNKEIIWSFQQYRPYVLMMNTRALASMNLKAARFDEALKHIRKGIATIEKFYKKFADKSDEDMFELEFLKQWANEIEEGRPLSDSDRLKRELEKAVLDEDYEQAAILRDEIILLQRHESHSRK
ncbi:MAG TPA: UvrB/UvrC motif-containing protein [bacterium]|nr:UvrB/UvrC motif-containing protein [bacterium]HPN44547.1 UvrB/UvrC motif-containing protein [bacterium]